MCVVTWTHLIRYKKTKPSDKVWKTAKGRRCQTKGNVTWFRWKMMCVRLYLSLWALGAWVTSLGTLYTYFQHDILNILHIIALTPHRMARHYNILPSNVMVNDVRGKDKQTSGPIHPDSFGSMLNFPSISSAHCCSSDLVERFYFLTPEI